jgi:DNA polymerase III psi subunit
MSHADNVKQSESSYANNAMTRLWRNDQDRETGAEAVEAIRARRQEQLQAEPQKRRGLWRLRRSRGH